jgi:multicomponent Na+:H+ antiporter subunit D
MLRTLLISSIIQVFIPLFFYKHEKFSKFFNVFMNIFILYNVYQINIAYINSDSIEYELWSVGNLSINFKLDTYGILFLDLLTLLWPAATIYSYEYMESDQTKYWYYQISLINLSIFCSIAIALSYNLFSLIIFYEILTISTAPLLITHDFGQSISAIKTYLIYLLGSSITMLLPSILILYSTGEEFFSPYSNAIENNFQPQYAEILFMLLFFGTAKAATFPLSQWLKNAMVAPYPISAILHAVAVVKSGLFFQLRIVVNIFTLDYLNSLYEHINYIIMFPVIGVLYYAYKAATEKSLKTTLAYSTIMHLNICSMMLCTFEHHGIVAGFLHFLSHSVHKITIFYSAGYLYLQSGAKKIKEFQGLFYKNKTSAFLLSISLLSLSGLPPLFGYLTKYEILSETLDYYKPYSLVILLSAISGMHYSMKIALSLYRKNLYNEHMNKNNKAISNNMNFVNLYCFILILVFFCALYQIKDILTLLF